MNLLSWLTYLSVLAFSFVRVESSFTPSARSGHSAVIYDSSSVYFQGGTGSNNSVSTDFFYLSLSTAFDTTKNSSIPWTNLSFPNQPFRANSFSCVSGKSIFIFGDTSLQVAQFDFTNQSWKTPTTNGSAQLTSISNQCLTTGDGNIYMFLAGNVITFNTANLSWTVNQTGMTTVRNKNNVILPDGTVVFVGGEATADNPSVYLLYQKIWTYNTKNGNWSQIDTKNNITTNCVPTASALVNDGRIIIFGCVSGIVVIDTKNNNEFSIPAVSNQGPPSNLVGFTGFTATPMGAYILIAFGQNTNTSQYSSNIYLLDVSQRKNFTWTTSFDPKNPKSDPANPSSSDSSDGSKVNGGLIAGVIIGIAVLIGIVSFLLYKRSRYMDSVRGMYMKKFGFSKSQNKQPDMIIPYQETSSISPYQDASYTYDPSRPIPEDGGGSSRMNEMTAQDDFQPNELSANEPYPGGIADLSRSSSVYSRQSDFEEYGYRAGN